MDLGETATRAESLLTRPLLYLGKAEDFLRKNISDTPILTATPREIGMAFYSANLGKKEAAQEMLNQLAPTRSHGRNIMLLETAVIIGDKSWAEMVLNISSRSRRGSRPRYVLASNPYAGATVIARHRGAAAAMLNRPDEAKAHYLDALEVATNMRFRPEIALTRFQLAELRFEHFPGERSEAVEHLDFAIDEFKEMKLQPYIEKVLKLRDRTAPSQ